MLCKTAFIVTQTLWCSTTRHTSADFAITLTEGNGITRSLPIVVLTSPQFSHINKDTLSEEK
jgi:hypothetical protein